MNLNAFVNPQGWSLFLKDLKRFPLQYEGLAVMFLLAFAVSLSNRITVNETVLLRIPLPLPIERVWGIFRSTGRFSWICVYLIMLFSITLFTRLSSQKCSSMLIFATLVIQCADMHPALAARRAYFSTEQTYTPPVTQDAQWETLAQHKSWNHLYLTGSVEQDILFDVAHFCLAHNKTLNTFYFAHASGTVLEENLRAALAAKGVFSLSPCA